MEISVGRSLGFKGYQGILRVVLRKRTENNSSRDNSEVGRESVDIP